MVAMKTGSVRSTTHNIDHPQEPLYLHPSDFRCQTLADAVGIRQKIHLNMLDPVCLVAQTLEEIVGRRSA